MFSEHFYNDYIQHKTQSTPDVRVHNSDMFVVSACPVTNNAEIYRNSGLATSITNFDEPRTMRSDSYVKRVF